MTDNTDLGPALAVVERRRFTDQRGAGMGMVMIGLVLIVFFATLAIRMVPAYATYWQVRSVMERLHEKPEAVAGGRGTILRALDSQLYIEGIRAVGRRDFSVAKGSRGLELTVDYEVRKHLFFNVDVIMHFTHTTVFQET
jgi:hypothetical protein